MSEKRAANAQQAAALSPNHGTPPGVVELGRKVMGHFDLDPASDGYWNHYTIKAKAFFDEQQNGLTRPWRGRLIENPPGTVVEPGKQRPTSLPRKFWEKTIDGYKSGEIESVFWVGFSIEQLAYLQGSPMHPLQFVTLFPAERLRFLRRPHQPWCAGVVAVEVDRGEREKLCNCGRSGNGPPEPGDSPMHGNYITLLPSTWDRAFAAHQVGTFMDLSQRPEYCPGALVRPAMMPSRP